MQKKKVIIAIMLVPPAETENSILRNALGFQVSRGTPGDFNDFGLKSGKSTGF